MMTLDDLIRAILAILPNATIGEDEDGQIVIHTGVREAMGDGTTVVIPVRE